MTRYNDRAVDFSDPKSQSVTGYRDGVDRVLEYVESIHAYPKLMAESKWAIDEGII